MDEQRKAEQQINTEDGTAVSGGDFASAGGQQVFGCTANDLRGSMVDAGSTYVDNSLNAGRDIKIDKRQVNNRIRGEE